jgi:hypothetical protein
VYFCGDNCTGKSPSSISAPTSAASSTGQSYTNSPMSAHVSPIASPSTAASSTAGIAAFSPLLLPTRITSLRGKAVACVSCGSSYFIVTTGMQFILSEFDFFF